MPRAKKVAVDNGEEIFVSRGQEKDEKTIMISVNGRNLFLPKGKKTKVPPEFAFEYNRAMLAQEAMEKRMDERIEAANEQNRRYFG